MTIQTSLPLPLLLLLFLISIPPPFPASQQPPLSRGSLPPCRAAAGARLQGRTSALPRVEQRARLPQAAAAGVRAGRRSRDKEIIQLPFTEGHMKLDNAFVRGVGLFV